MVFHFEFKGNEFMSQTLIFYYYIFAIRCLRPLILKYQRFKPPCWKDIGICIFDKNLVPFLSINEIFCHMLLV